MPDPEPESRARVHVANRHGQRICGIVRRRHLVQSEQQLDHLLHLPLVRTAVSHDGALHFGRRVLEHFATGFDRGENRDAARVTELERASRVGRVEQILDDDALRADTRRDARKARDGFWRGGAGKESPAAAAIAPQVTRRCRRPSVSTHP